MKCIRCKTQTIIPWGDKGEFTGYYCENCGANYDLRDDSGY